MRRPATARKAGTPGGEVLTIRALNRATLERQLLRRRASLTPVKAIERVAGLQAQYSPSPFIGLWSRLARFEIADLNQALDRRSVVKLTLMRNTLHLVSGSELADYDVAITAVRVPAWRGRAKALGVDWDGLHESTLRFVESEPRTLDEIRTFVEERVKGTKGRWEAWQLVSARGGLVHVPPSGTWRFHRAARYTSRRSWRPGSTPDPDPDEALGRTIRRYVAGYGPVALADVQRWSGERRLPRLRAALGTLEKELRHFRDEAGRDLVDLARAARPNPDADVPLRFLPRWDSVIIGYDDRDRILPPRHVAAVVKKNGDFLPTVLVDGFVAATWRIEREREAVTLHVEPLERVAAGVRDEIEGEGGRLLRFVEPDAGSHDVRIGASA